MYDDTKFVEAVRSYIHVVTHYFAAKSEIWFALVMKPVHGVKDVVGRMEFTEGRGAIHRHWLGKMNNRSVATWNPHSKLWLVRLTLQDEDFISINNDF